MNWAHPIADGREELGSLSVVDDHARPLLHTGLDRVDDDAPVLNFLVVREEGEEAKHLVVRQWVIGRR
jgi:hypothetical protein